MNKKVITTVLPLFALAFTSHAKEIAHFPMDVEMHSITETVTGNTYTLISKNEPENIPGAKGQALRFDGYSTYVTAKIDGSGVKDKMTFSVWCAAETYPMMITSEAQNIYSLIAGNIDDNAQTGFGFMLSSQGDLKFKCYMSVMGFASPIELSFPEKMKTYEWNHLAAVVDGTAKTIKLYLNGEEKASQNINNRLDAISVGNANFMIGKPKDDLKQDMFLINTFNGLIDDITIHDTVLTADELKSEKPENEADLSIPESRFADSQLRPRFHGMPGAGWTNETHGFVKYDGKYHVFFQKNANGAYMARLHWGHISSDNLYDWKEEKIAIAPGESYDIKGCWSGCVFTDQFLTKGKPEIWYTAVDNGRATIAHATASDDALINWTKDSGNPVVNGRPNGLSDDFRDCYLFTSDGKYYMIVGTSKDNLGACTLHRYDSGSKTWSNDGSIFFQATSKQVGGRFWEMANITPMGNGKWLFTATPLETGVGVEVLYWVGTINSDGTFKPLPAYETQPGKVELDGFSRDGYGLLSPSIAQADGKTLALGIVPDKLPTNDNYNLGWAHNYSLPREWSLDENDRLVQKPFEGLAWMRSSTAYSKDNFQLSGTQALSPVSGRQVEIIGEFEIGTSFDFGFNLFKNADGQCATLSYTPTSNTLKLDFSKLPRLINDSGVYNGVYESTLPETFSRGEIIKLHVFIDHSIIDIFVNDKWAASVRLFPTGDDADGVEAFSTGATTVKSLKAWTLDENLAGVAEITSASSTEPTITVEGNQLHYSNVAEDSVMTIYSISGAKIADYRLYGGEGDVTLQCDKGLYIAAIENNGMCSAKKIIIR